MLKDYGGKRRQCEMVFNTIEALGQVERSYAKKRIKEFGKYLGNWLREFVIVNVGKEDTARGNELGVRAKFFVYEPLLRGFYLRSSPEDEEKTC